MLFHSGFFVLNTVTPADYQPPGFCQSEFDSFKFEDEPMNIKVGDVATVCTLIFVQLLFIFS